MWATMQCAIERINAAACLGLDMNLSRTGHMVRWGAPDEMPNGSSGYVMGDSWSKQYIRLRIDMPEHHRCPVLVHEMIHVLRRSYSHPGPPESMTNPVTSASRSKITAGDLALICAKQACGCFNPETPAPDPDP
jgi:hypothetical protein